MVTVLFLRKLANKVSAAERCASAAYYKCQWEELKGNGEASKGYLAYRWLHCGLLAAAILSSALSNDEGLPGRWPIFLTNWALVVYFVQSLVAVHIVFTAYKIGKKGLPIKISSKLLETYGALHSTSIILALGVTIIYWSFVYDPSIHQLDFVNLTVHASNSAIMVVDLFIVAHPMRLIHVFLPPLFTLMYTIFNVIYFLCGGTDRKGNHYVYRVIDWTKPYHASLFVLGGMFLLVILFLIIWFLSVLRRKIAVKLFARRHNSSLHGEPTAEITLA